MTKIKKKPKKKGYAPEQPRPDITNGEYHCIGCGSRFGLSSSNPDTQRYCTKCLWSMMASMERMADELARQRSGDVRVYLGRAPVRI